MFTSQIAQQRSSGSGSRIYGPSNLEDGFHLARVPKPALEKIKKIYGRVKLDKETLDDGLCFGLLDPACNIVVNSFILAGSGKEQAEDKIQRSLNGLVAFLTYLFPYLPQAEAMKYLEVAGADPLVAAHLVIIRRGLRDFCLCNNTAAVETALSCAAAAARHPDPDRFVLGWKVLSSSDLKWLVTKLSLSKPDFGSALSFMNRLRAIVISAPSLDLRVSWELARERLSLLGPVGKELPPARAAMKRILLAQIHGFYLNALGCLPTDELCSTYHRSMLSGGYCYGPLDPVSNIIVNTIWFDVTFPTSKQVTLKMISTKCLWRVAARSLYGLISFLCTRYPRLTPDQAMQRLIVTGVDLRVADPCLLGTPKAAGMNKKLDWSGGLQIGSGQPSTFEIQLAAVDACAPSTDVVEAYAAAATAALHPNPAAQKVFLGSSNVPNKLLMFSDLIPVKVHRVLSKDDIAFLSGAIQRSESSVDKRHKTQDSSLLKLNRSTFSHVSQCESRFFGQLKRVSKMVEAALDAYNSNNVTAGPPFKLHVICGANELVSGPEFSTDPEVKGYSPWTPNKYHHSHINFLAVPEGQQGGAATLFFAECGNHDKNFCWCLPVKKHDPLAEQVRCIYCEAEGSRIIHTTDHSFHGRDTEFVKVSLGEPLFGQLDDNWYTNDAIISKSRNVVWVHGVEDDAIYLNYSAAPLAHAAPGDPKRIVFKISIR